jgi:hypothetical protein
MTVDALIEALQTYKEQYPCRGKGVMVIGSGGFVTGVSWLGETDYSMLEVEPFPQQDDKQQG